MDRIVHQLGMFVCREQPTAGAAARGGPFPSSANESTLGSRTSGLDQHGRSHGKPPAAWQQPATYTPANNAGIEILARLRGAELTARFHKVTAGVMDHAVDSAATMMRLASGGPVSVAT